MNSQDIVLLLFRFPNAEVCILLTPLLSWWLAVLELTWTDLCLRVGKFQIHQNYWVFSNIPATHGMTMFFHLLFCPSVDWDECFLETLNIGQEGFPSISILQTSELSGYPEVWRAFLMCLCSWTCLGQCCRVLKTDYLCSSGWWDSGPYSGFSTGMLKTSSARKAISGGIHEKLKTGMWILHLWLRMELLLIRWKWWG